MKKFIKKFQRLFVKMIQKKINIIYVKFKYTIYSILRSGDKFDICYYNQANSYDTSFNTTVYIPAYNEIEEEDLDQDQVIDWFINDWKSLLDRATFYTA